MDFRYRSLRTFLPWWTCFPHQDWAEKFGRQAPLDLEIGAGNGDFLAARARQHPERNLLGLDLKWSSLIRAMRRLDQSGAEHVRLLQTDARTALGWLFPAGSVSNVFVLFPCPWPRDRTIKHRLLDPPFLRLLNRCLVDGGRVEMATDFQPYFEWVKEQVPGHGFSMEAARVPPEWGTRYERKWREQGQQEFFRLVLHKEEALPFTDKEDVTLITRLVDHFDPKALPPLVVDGPVHIRSKELLYDAEREVGMLRTIIVEENLQQHVWIRIHHHHQGRWKIFPASGTGCVPTEGVQLALDTVQALIQGGAVEATQESA